MADVTTTFAAKDESFAKTVDKLQKRLKGFDGEIKGFSARVSSMAGSFKNLLGPLAAAGAAFLGVKSAADAFFGAIRIGGELNDLSARTGESVGNLAILRRAFENAGSSAEAVGPMINRLQRFIVEAGNSSGAQAKALDALGISLQGLKTKSATEQMELLAKSIASVPDPAERSALAMAIFGRSGGELMPLLRAMGVELDTARAQLGSWPEALDKANQALDAIGDNFTAIKNKGIEFATGLLVNVAPGLAEVTKKIAEIDAARLGMVLSDHLAGFLRAADGALNFTKNLDAVKIAIQGLASGQISQGLSLLFVTAKIQALSLVNEFVKSFVAGLQTIGGFFADMFDSKGALFHLMSTLFGAMGDIMKERLFRAMVAISEQLGIFSDEITQAFKIQADSAANSYKMAMFGIGAQVDLVAEQMFDAGMAMPTAFADNRSKLQPLFDLTNDLQIQEQLTRTIAQNAAMTSTNLNGATGRFRTDIEAADQTLARVPNYGQQLAASALGMREQSAAFKENIEGSKVSAEVTAKLYNEMSETLIRTAANVQLAAEKVTRVFEGVVSAGVQLDVSVVKSGESFVSSTKRATEIFVNGVRSALTDITSPNRNLATETTQRAVLQALQTLNNKLPQPVIA